MASYDSIVVVEDWISEHYFTSADRGTTFQKSVLALRTQWNNADKAKEGSVRSRFNAHRTDYLSAVTQLTEEREGSDTAAAAEVSSRVLREIFYGRAQALTQQQFERGNSDLVLSGAWLGTTEDVLWLDATPATALEEVVTGSHLLGDIVLDGKTQDNLPTGKVLSEIFLSTPSPEFIVVCSGQYLILAERERWPEGRFLAVNAQLVAERNEGKRGGEIDRFLAIFGRDSIIPAADGSLWWKERLDESRDHAIGVSEDLREGIRESIEIIANEVLQRRLGQGFSNEKVDGQELARQALRFLYRILFLLYAEASPELGVLPKGAGEYDTGYGLDRLRELVQVDLTSHSSQTGTHLYDSLYLLFTLINGDHPSQQKTVPQAEDVHDGIDAYEGLRFEPLEADLFSAEATSLIDQVKLGNFSMQKVLERLLLSRSGGKAERGFISYANLGINQLGAVYEGLMSYTGFIAQEDLREVAKDGKADKGSWVVPVDKIDSIPTKHFVRRRNPLTNEEEPVHYPKGSFVFRLAGRDRQTSASYYSPEVITKFVVSQALGELLTEETPADDILTLDVCEPALGSGAFAVEAVRQLAAEYLKRKQTELGQEIPAEDYPEELQRVKAQVALHQIHGVDLNATAVELAEVSLWLDTMQPGLNAPWFGLRLKRGNSLLGARHAVYSRKAVEGKKYLSEEPDPIPLEDLANSIDIGNPAPSFGDKIFHFLLPAEGWGAAAEAKDVKDLVGEEQKKLTAWARSTKVKLSKPQIDRLIRLSSRVEELWAIALQRLRVAEQEARRFVDIWPHTRGPEETSITRTIIEKKLTDPDGAFQRLKRIMNAWNALWFWPVTKVEVPPPTIDQWLDAIELIVGVSPKQSKMTGQFSLAAGVSWDELNQYEHANLGFAGARNFDHVTTVHPWLEVCDQISAEQGFFHWELEFAPVFGRGGFDLQVGNPPWVRPRSDVESLLAEHDVWWQLAEKPTQSEKRKRRAHTLSSDSTRKEFVENAVPTPVLAAFVRASSQNALLRGQQPDLYRAFMLRTWRSASRSGVVALIHPESHFTEKEAKYLRAESYQRLRRHWQFINELRLFEISHLVSYGVHVYRGLRENPDFIMAASLYHPETVTRSLDHDGSGDIPGLKDEDGKWDRRPHKERVIAVDTNTLSAWGKILEEPGTPYLYSRMVYPVNQQSMVVLEKLGRAPRVRDLGLRYSFGWHESTDRRKGYFEVGSRINNSWVDVILQGPHLTVGNPFYKEPNPTMRNNQDWSELDLEALTETFIPRTSYQRNLSSELDYNRDYTHWDFDGKKVPSRCFFRLAWRRMASVTGVRTFHVAIIPPNACHVNGIISGGAPKLQTIDLLSLLGALSSLPVDFMTKAASFNDFYGSVVDSLPIVTDPGFRKILGLKAARLICLTSEFAPLWEEAFQQTWFRDSATRNALARRQLLIDLDAICALGFGITADELCSIYRTQFSVLRGYEENDLYDANGRKIPNEMNRQYRMVGEAGMSTEDLKWTHPQSKVEYTFEFPFRSFDREEDMRKAYAKFSRMLEEHGEIIEEE